LANRDSRTRDLISAVGRSRPIIPEIAVSAGRVAANLDSSDGVLVWTKLRVSNGALEGMNNKVKVISHRAYGYRTTWTYIANIYHCCAALPLP
jgi:transposase